MTTILRLLLFGFVFGLMSALPIAAQEQASSLVGVTLAPLDDADFADLDAYVDDVLVRYGGSGAAVAIVQNGDIVYLKGFGVTEMGGSIPVDGDTQFIIASLVKSMTALMIGTLIEDGMLTWDTPVSEVLPSFALSDPAVTKSVTFRDLLSMRSGLPVFDAPWLLMALSPEQIIESLAQIPLSTPVGEAFHYSNLGYSSAGFISAIAAGGEYGDNLLETYTGLMQERVFNPIGMDRTTLDYAAPIASENRAAPVGYGIETGRFDTISFELEQSAFSTLPSGGGWSTAEDLAKYLILQMNAGVASDGTRIISEALLEDMWEPHVRSGETESFGLGWTVGEFHGLQALSYAGGLPGYVPRLQFLPEANLGVVVLTNRSLSPMARAVTDYVYELAFDLEHTAEADIIAFDQFVSGALTGMTGMVQPNLTPEAAAPYLGQYGQGIAVTLNDANGITITTANGDLALYPIQGQTGLFFIGDIYTLSAQFTENADGVMTLTFVSTLGDPQPPFVLTQLE